MSVKNERLSKIRKKIAQLIQEEKSALNPWHQKKCAIKKWGYFLAHEFIKDDVRVRAESLAYLMLFSLLPLLAGLFFLVSVFSQVGMVQEAIESVMQNIFSRIPEAHRDYLAGYVLRFKDLYLTSLVNRSSSLGIFSFLVLAWVGLKVYTNIDSTMNHIWSSERQRPLIEKIRNFIVVTAIAPIVLIAGISIPLVAKQWAQRISLDSALSPVFTLMNGVVPSALIFMALLAMYRYLPVEKVKWKSALWGALLATLALQLTNVFIQFYFKFGTQTAYGKAAVLPILGLWIYFAWMMVILGGEISYLVQHGKEVVTGQEWTPSFLECEGITQILVEAHRVYLNGVGPLSFSEIQRTSRLDAAQARKVVQQLCREKFLIECVSPGDPEGEYFGVVKDLSKMTVEEVLRSFFKSSLIQQQESLWGQSLETWLAFFRDKRLEQL